MSQSNFDLSDLFGAALQTVTAKRQDINTLDGYNGNHGDNMVQNLNLILDALQGERSQPPAEALQHASQKLESEGRGGTSQYYAQGLRQAAEQLQGHSNLDENDVMSLVQTMLGAIPSQGYGQQAQGTGSVLEQVMGLASEQRSQAGGEDDALDLGDVLDALLPAGLAFLQAKQAGADTASAARQALIGALAGGRVNPLQAGTPRTAAGGLIAQSMLQALAGRR